MQHPDQVVVARKQKNHGAGVGSPPASQDAAAVAAAAAAGDVAVGGDEGDGSLFRRLPFCWAGGLVFSSGKRQTEAVGWVARKGGSALALALSRLEFSENVELLAMRRLPMLLPSAF